MTQSLTAEKTAPSTTDSNTIQPSSEPRPVLRSSMPEGMFNIRTVDIPVGEHTVHIEYGRLARSASAAVEVRCDEMVMLVTATGSEKPRPGIDFFPLLCDYEEKMYSVGRFPGGYLKKEGRPSEKAVLTSRLIDRPIRPLWPDGYRKDVQVVAAPQSLDSVHQPDVLAILGASAALELSGLPWFGPIGAVRIGRINGKFVVNPTFAQQEDSDLDLIVSGTRDSIMMVEAGAEFVTEQDLLEAIELAHSEIKKQVDAITKFAKECGVEKQVYTPEVDLAPLTAYIDERSAKAVEEAYHAADRDARKEKIAAIKDQLKADVEALPEDHPVKQVLAASELDFLGETFKKLEKRVMRTMVIEENVRADGRKPDEIRPIYVEVGMLPRAHGSALFTRGSTQVLSVATLGSPGDSQELDGVDPAKEKRWLHHYNFPGFSVGEVKPMRGAGRREIGHGALAERAVASSLPEAFEFPYTLRVNSDVLESNGSTSMASTCGASLALMDAGVPVKCPIGGIAMGLIKEGERTVVLSDIQGLEDFLGDMDFKVTGNQTGVTALQMDIKIQGISLDIMRTALEQARVGRLHILGRMAEALPGPRTSLSPWAPFISSIKIDPDQIGAVIGPAGKNIRSITESTGADIDIANDGTVTITSVGQEGGNRARQIIEDMTRKIEVGEVYEGKVVRILPIGAFVELIPGKDGMVHISQIVPYRIGRVEDAINEGDKILVQVVDIDDRGRINLTHKGVPNEVRAEYGYEPLPAEAPEGFVPSEPAPREPRRDGGGGGRGGRDRGRR